jgi:hypothetical protein
MSDIPTIINVWTIYGEPRSYSNGETVPITKLTLFRQSIPSNVSPSITFVTGETKPF